MNSELTKISLWMKSNKLSVNIKKTNYVIFKPKQKSVHMSSQISLDSIPLKQVTEVKFLGIYIDEGLTWKSHISYICKKISKSVGIMYRFCFLLSSNTKKSLYYTLIYPYLTYCTTVRSSTSYVTNLNHIFLLQKRAVRAMTNSNHLAPSAPLFAQLNILDIFKVNSLYIAKFMFSYHQRLLPSPFLNLFPTGGQIHNKLLLEPQLIFDLTPAELISSNLLYSIEGQKYGMLCHYQLPLPLVYPPSKESFLISSVNCMKRLTLSCLYSLTTVC